MPSKSTFVSKDNENENVFALKSQNVKLFILRVKPEKSRAQIPRSERKDKCTGPIAQCLRCLTLCNANGLLFSVLQPAFPSVTLSRKLLGQRFPLFLCWDSPGLVPADPNIARHGRFLGEAIATSAQIIPSFCIPQLYFLVYIRGLNNRDAESLITQYARASAPGP